MSLLRPGDLDAAIGHPGKLPSVLLADGTLRAKLVATNARGGVRFILEASWEDELGCRVEWREHDDVGAGSDRMVMEASRRGLMLQLEAAWRKSHGQDWES